ncbi:LAMI_0E02872g1_1 [Lachancea mirantina]|uniref:LAMI_0E02872g1_1 n=1 Tax=Lachancea mirantina TaxID=1230905 RepID=A0A1G4JJX6_9SACH|nr:LAMI_0E02872g1_1 [Lachancea mirantina]
MWSGLLLHWCGVLSVLAKPSTSKNIIQLPRSSDRSSISLVCRAKKVSRIHEMPPHAYTTCIGFSAEDALVQNTRAEELIGLSLLIDVQNSLPYEVDLTRLGPKSIGSRKQSLDLEITDTAGNLLRARRNVPRGKTGIWLQPPATGTPLLNVCFTNLVYDASWRTIDMDKIATITVLGPGGHRWSEDVLADDSSKDLLQGIVLHTRALAEDKRIVQTEESHRDINENTLELYTRGQTIIMITHFLLELGISYYIRHLVKQRIRRARHR